MIVVLESAKKHGLSEDEVRAAWEHVQEYRSLGDNRWPPHYMGDWFFAERTFG